MPNQNSAQPEFNLTQPVRNLVKLAPVFVASNATVAEAAEQMQRARIGSVLIATEPPGILTDRDLRGRVVAASKGPGTPVTQVMTRPLITIDSDAPAFSALRLMIDANIHHLPLVEEGKIVGIISATDLLAQQANHPIYLRGVIDRLEDPLAIGNYARQIAVLANTLFEGGLGALQISQIVSGLNDALVKRLVQLAEQALGRAPAPYAWIVFGSEGRMEQTLLTDQDNALIFAAGINECQSYFDTLSKRVVDGLIQAGFPPCPGGFMASNWCKPLAEWCELFNKWVRLPEPQALLDAAIFFDFRAVAGSLSLEPLEIIITSAQNEKRFLAHMVNGALAFHPPLGFFNRLRSENGKIDMKNSGIAPIVGLARVAALAAGSRERSTPERLRVAGASGNVIDRDSAQSLAETMPLFLRLRLRAQLTARKNHQAIDNNINLNDLSSLDRRHLKEAFVLVKRVQENLRAVWRLDSLA
jgi:CBS domain-containing protein